MYACRRETTMSSTTMLSKTLSVLLAVYLLPHFSHGRRYEKYFQQDYTYIEALDSFYKIHTTPLTFADAKEMCDMEGSSLFYPEDGDETNVVLAYLKRVHPSADWPVYLGLTDMQTEGEFQSIDGRTSSDLYKQWRGGEPNNHGPGDEDCVILYRQGDMNDVPCSDKFRFICKKKDYSYIKAVDSYYRIHTTQRTFADAKQTCALEGASLFFPENDAEANAVIAFWEKVHPSTNWPVYVGLTDMATEGTFLTIDDRAISHVYKNWKAGEPNNYSPGDEDCVILYRQGNMNDVPCGDKFRFICKKNDYNYIEAEDSYYKVHTIPRTFADAKQTCILEGASLFYPEDGDEVKAVIAYWRKVQPSTDWPVYLGLTDVNTEGKFQTVDVSETEISNLYKNWQEDEPNNYGPGDEDCVVLYRQGDMNDVQCVDKFPFICKKKDYSYIEAVDSYFKIHETPRTFADAKQTCVLEGASLFYPEDDAEANAVIAFWKRVQPAADWAMVIGLTDMQTEGRFQTIDGRPISDVYKNWRKGEPNNHGPGDEDCVMLYYTANMNDIDCGNKFPFICKKKDYIYINAVNSYYKIHTKSRTFTDAKQTCDLEGASLFYPEDEDEANAVMAYLKRVHPSTDWPVLVGLTDMATEGKFQTIDGKTGSDVYQHWRTDEPNNHGPGDEDCVVLHRKGEMNDVQCDDKYRFICKRKDYNYIAAVDSYYKIHTIPRTFADAKQMCVLEGASLYYPEDDAEANAVIAHWKKVQPSTDWAMYVGLTDLKTEGTFQTIDGKTVSTMSTHWRKGEPNNHGPGGEDCVVLFKRGDLNDVSCDNQYRFICKKKDYSYIQAVDSYYKIHTIPRTFVDAKQMCILEGASLFYPEDENEANAVTEFWKRVQPATDWAVYVGLTDMKTEGTFKTIDEKAISDVYIHWRQDEPNNYGPGDEDCVILYRQGDMNDVQCDDKYRFICKKNEYKYIDAVDSYYKIHLSPLSFADAKKKCALEGANLFYPGNKEEAHAVIEFWKKTQPSAEWLFVGMSDSMQEGVFETIDGKGIQDVYTHWLEGEPTDEASSEDCIQMNRQGYINDIQCDKKFGFICKRHPQQKWDVHCNMPNLDYTLSENTGNCYKLHTTALTWTEAYEVCRAEQSHLVVINNYSEYSHLEKLIMSVSKQTVGYYYVGISNVPNEGWQTVTGQSDASAWWGETLPAPDETKRCGLLTNIAYLTYKDCNTKNFFICEHEVDG